MLFPPSHPAVVRRQRFARRGAATVEFAVICLPLVLLIAAALELGRAMMVQEFMANAARTACRYAVVQPAPTDNTNLTNIEARATHTLAIALVNTSAVNVYYFTPSDPSYTPPTLSSTWTSYPSTSSAHPTSGDYVRVNVQVNARDVSWVPFYWFLGKNQLLSVNKDMIVE